MLPVTTHAQSPRVSRYVSVDYIVPPPAAAPQPAPEIAPPVPVAEAGRDNEQPVDFTADTLEHDEAAQLVTARGNVVMIQAGRKLTADMVQYNLAADKVTATGNVVVTETNGDVYTADKFDLTDDMKDGFIEKMQATLADGSRFWAKEGTRTGGTKMVLKDAIYTPCEPCKKDPSAAPVWQLRAGEVIHDKEDARVTYRDARFELFGTPIAYTPYFSHPDGTVDQKSGLLTPTMGLDSEFGASYGQEYYWAIAPDKDATVGVEVFSEANPLVTAEYRQRFEDAEIRTRGGVTYSERTDSVSNQAVDVKDEWRGHLFTEGLYNIDDQWRAGIRSKVVSDDQYARQYDITNEDVLENELYAERFDDRNYAVARAMAFQDIRVSEREREQPMILPEVQASFKGDPNQTLGGRWSFDASGLGLERDGNGQDMARGTLEAGWQRHDIMPVGLVSTLDLTARSDAYNIRDRDVAPIGSGRSGESNKLRGFAQANWQVGFPLVNHFHESGTQLVIEPIGALTAGTNVKVDSDIPNEDSQDIFLDAPKLFEPNRFAGYDRIEDGTRATYGLRTGLYGDEGWSGEVFLGQSYRFNREPALFPEGSGLSEKKSDYVGSIDVNTGPFNMNYRFQLDSEQLSSRRHELASNANLGFMQLGAGYFYSTPLVGTDLDDPREQGLLTANIPITDEWQVFGGVRYDFGQNEGMREGYYGLGYIGQCINVYTTARRELTRDSSGDSSTEILLRIGLKNLGEFESSVLNVSSDDE